MTLLFAIAVTFVLILVFTLTFFYYYHLVCFCLPRQANGGGGCFVDLETPAYVPSRVTCTRSYYWVCFLNRRMKLSKIVYLYGGKKLRYYPANEATPIVPYMNYHDTCPICLEQFSRKEELIKLICEHFYHRQCIRQWVADKCISHCPLCNHDVYTETIVIEEPPIERRRIARRVYIQRPWDEIV